MFAEVDVILVQSSTPAISISRILALNGTYVVHIIVAEPVGYLYTGEESPR